MDRYEQYLFFKKHAGGVGIIDPNGRTAWQHAKNALSHARAESLLEEAIELGVAELRWEDDDQPYEHDGFTAEEMAEKFESNEWTGPYGCAISIGDDRYAASLWGIVVGPRGTDDPYCRVVAAELAWEIEDDLRQAIGDARDRELEPLT